MQRYPSELILLTLWGVVPLILWDSIGPFTLEHQGLM